MMAAAAVEGVAAIEGGLSECDGHAQNQLVNADRVVVVAVANARADGRVLDGTLPVPQ